MKRYTSYTGIIGCYTLTHIYISFYIKIYYKMIPAALAVGLLSLNSCHGIPMSHNACKWVSQAFFNIVKEVPFLQLHEAAIRF